MRLLVIFGRPTGFLKLYLLNFLKLKMDLETGPLRYLQPSSYLTCAIAFFMQNFYLRMRL